VQRSATTDRTLVMSRSAVRVRSSALCTLCTGTKKSRLFCLDLPPSLKEAKSSTTTSRRCTTAYTWRGLRSARSYLRAAPSGWRWGELSRWDGENDLHLFATSIRALSSSMDVTVVFLLWAMAWQLAHRGTKSLATSTSPSYSETGLTW
jgi:hypothetical protein